MLMTALSLSPLSVPNQHRAGREQDESLPARLSLTLQVVFNPYQNDKRSSLPGDRSDTDRQSEDLQSVRAGQFVITVKV